MSRRLRSVMDLRELPEDARREMKFVFAERIEEVLDAALPAGVAARQAAQASRGG